MGSKRYTDLIVGQRADEVRNLVYNASERFPADQKFALASQLQTAALSICGNIAEGFGRRHPKDKAKSYIVSKASAEELSDDVRFAQDRGFWSDIQAVSSKIDEVERMLRVLIRKTYEMGKG